MSNENNNGVIDFDSSSFIQNSETTVNNNLSNLENVRSNSEPNVAVSDINVDDIFGSWDNTPSTQEEVKPISNDYNNSSVELNGTSVDNASNIENNVQNAFQSNVNPMEVNIPFEMPKLDNSVNGGNIVNFDNGGLNATEASSINTPTNIENSNNDLTNIALNTLANNFNINDGSLENSAVKMPQYGDNQESTININKGKSDEINEGLVQTEPIFTEQAPDSSNSDNGVAKLAASNVGDSIGVSESENNNVNFDANFNQNPTNVFTPNIEQSVDIQNDVNVQNTMEPSLEGNFTNNLNNNEEFAINSNLNINHNENNGNFNNGLNNTNMNNFQNLDGSYGANDSVLNTNANINNANINAGANNPIMDNVGINNPNMSSMNSEGSNNEFNAGLANNHDSNIINNQLNIPNNGETPVDVNLQKALSTPNIQNVATDNINNVALGGSINVGNIPNNGADNVVNISNIDNSDTSNINTTKKGKINLPIIMLALIIVVSIGVIILKKDVLAAFFETLMNNRK